MGNRKTRVKYNPKTRDLPGTNLALLARASHLIARREARVPDQAEPQPRGLTFANSRTLWTSSGTTSGASSTTSKENSSSSSKSSSTSLISDESTSTAPDDLPRLRKRKTPPSIYQQEIARKKRKRAQNSSPQRSSTPSTDCPATTNPPTSTTNTTMYRHAAKEVTNTKIRSQARHEAYHGTILPETTIGLPTVQTRRTMSTVDDEPPHGAKLKPATPPPSVSPPPSEDRKTPSRDRKTPSVDRKTPSRAGKRKANGLHKTPTPSPTIDPKDLEVPATDIVLLTKSELAEEKKNCHFCQLEAFSTDALYPITVENVLQDGSTFPNDFRFIEHPIFGTGVERSDPAFRAGCNCASAKDCQSDACACHNPDDEATPYHTKGPRTGLLKKAYWNSPLALFECHDACLNCKDCPNRVVDNGRKIPLTIFRTPDGRGWGVKSTADIHGGQFIDKYVGEILTPSAADHRRKSADRAERKDIYLFALDKFEDEEPIDGQPKRILEVDGEFFGGATRFINHSCDPNLRIFARVGDESEKYIHDLAFFAIKDIKAGTELTFDYVDGHAENVSFDDLSEDEIIKKKSDMAKCLCGARKCRGYLW